MDLGVIFMVKKISSSGDDREKREIKTSVVFLGGEDWGFCILG